jgi:hypothetical protein
MKNINRENTWYDFNPLKFIMTHFMTQNMAYLQEFQVTRKKVLSATVE